MNKFSKEYFNDNCYFLIEGNGNDFVLSYSVYGTISESKKNEGKKKFDKKSYNKIKKVIDKHINSKNKSSKKEIETDLDSVELDEYVDSDGTFLTSKTPIYNMWTHPKKTMDQTINSTRNAGYSVTRGYRVYYGEGEEKDGEYSEENLVFKVLRRNGYLEKIRNLKDELTDKKLTLKEFNWKYIKVIRSNRSTC